MPSSTSVLKTQMDKMKKEVATKKCLLSIIKNNNWAAVSQCAFQPYSQNIRFLNNFAAKNLGANKFGDKLKIFLS